MLDDKGFDLWADGYDQSVGLCEEAGEYPFAGYKNVLNEIYRTIHKKKQARILDIGFGTGTLTKRLYDDGYEIFGVDFSARMLEIAKKKMPNAVLVQHDFTKGLQEALLSESFDYIISTYALHHLTDAEKTNLIKQCKTCMSDDGMILIGDVAFETRMNLNICKDKSKDQWDTDETYIVFEELKQHFRGQKMSFREISHCAGIVSLM